MKKRHVSDDLLDTVTKGFELSFNTSMLMIKTQMLLGLSLSYVLWILCA